VTLPSSSTPNTKNTSNDDSQIQEIRENSVHSQKKKQEMQLKQPFEKSSSFEEGGQKHCEITQALIYMICKDNLPMSCVEKNGLQKFIRTVCPLYKLPSRKKVVFKLLLV
ncbi:hypothetical protein HF086_000407, partial [Spodoptera exigua]